jgi:hypothetical protein
MSGPVGFEIRGIEALRRALANLPADLGAEASQLALRHVQEAESVIRPVYAAHAVTGRLARALTVRSFPVGQFSRATVIRARAAHLFERGTGTRRTRQGWNRGAARSHRTFPEPVQRAQAAFDLDLANLLRRAGLEVRRG